MLGFISRISGAGLTAEKQVQDRSRAIVEILERRVLLTAIVSGERVLGEIVSDVDFDSFTFSANAGDSVILSIGELANWAPRLEVFAPDSSSLGTVSGSVSTTDANRQIELLDVPQSGAYTAIVSGVGSSTGEYAHSLAKHPGAQPFDLGPLVSGERMTGTIARGDLDVYTFTADPGDSLLFSIGELANWAPQLDIFGPDGTRVDTVSGAASTTDANRQMSC